MFVVVINSICSRCNADPAYRQYDCIKSYVRQHVVSKQDCLLPHQMKLFGGDGANGTQGIREWIRECKTTAEFRSKHDIVVSS